MQVLTAFVLAAFVAYAGAWYVGAIEGNFALLLFLATLVTGLYWLAERFYFLPRRREAAARLEAERRQQAEQERLRAEQEKQRAEQARLEGQADLFAAEAAHLAQRRAERLGVLVGRRIDLNYLWNYSSAKT